MATSPVEYTRVGGVARITLNRPEVLNSFNREMGQDLIGVLTELRRDDQIRAVLLTGAGRAFCAGQDLAEFRPEAGKDLPDLGLVVEQCYNPIVRLLRTTEKPFVCAVNGVAAGAGASLALACDIVLASERASFIQSFCKVGLIPDSGGTFFLPRLVGFARASALALLGDKVSAAEAVEIGLIYKVYSEQELMPAAEELAQKLATQPTRGLGLIKRALNASLSNDLHSQLHLELELQRKAGSTADYAEGVAAFFEKRDPRFTGK